MNECEYWLIDNLMYNCKHVRRATWWRRMLRFMGGYSLLLDRTTAKHWIIAERNFQLKGWHFGLFHVDLTRREESDLLTERKVKREVKK